METTCRRERPRAGQVSQRTVVGDDAGPLCHDLDDVVEGASSVGRVAVKEIMEEHSPESGVGD